MASPHFSSIRFGSLLAIGIPLLLASVATGLQAEEGSSGDLRFDPRTINRYSLDHLPRSLSILQGGAVWIGYDLERAKVYKAWRVPEKGTGLNPSGFVVRSDGEVLIEDKSELSWTLRLDKAEAPLQIRYLGCVDGGGHYLLRWEMRHGDGILTLLDRIDLSNEPSEEAPVRKLRIENFTGLSSEAFSLLPPATSALEWRITTGKETKTEKSEISGPGWHRLTLR